MKLLSFITTLMMEFQTKIQSKETRKRENTKNVEKCGKRNLMQRTTNQETYVCLNEKLGNKTTRIGRSIKLGKTCGEDELPPKLIKWMGEKGLWTVKEVGR